MRLCDLDVRIEGTWVEGCIGRLRDELAARGLRLRPHHWVSSEWFTPVGVPGIAIPFYLLHPRLMRLERRQMLEVEGGSRDSCIKLLRHECGHAIQQAYRLHRRRRWQRHFGKASTPYPDSYRPRPASRRFVQHLPLHYAQSHPDEDFAETFAVWMQPRHRWRRRYEGWPALAKLEYVDELMGELRGAPAPVRSRRHVDPLTRLRTTLAEHYEERRRQYGTDAFDVYDRDLRRVFSDDPRHGDWPRAGALLRRHRREIRAGVSRWTGEHQFILEQVLDDMIQRARELDLRAVGDEARLLTDFSLMLAVHTTRSLYDRRRLPM